MLKRTFFLVTALLSGVTALAQDLIVKIDSTRIEARVAEISPEAVRYKRFARPDGPTYLLPTAQICYIRYADGFIEDYNRTTAPVAPAPAPQPQAQATPAPAPAPAPSIFAPSENYVIRYAIGQIYDHNGVRGIVCALNEERTHGLLLSLDEVMIDWSIFRKGDLRKIGADNRTDGEANMKAVARYIADNNLSWEHFPAFKWCRDKGEGWYLPSIDELLTIGHQYNGGSRAHNDRQARIRFNEALRDNGGERIDGKCYYHSSTEFDEKFSMMTHMSLEPPYVITDVAKYTKFLVRAVRKF